ncbi:DUF6538 domain-containing protein [uncultured Roseibium sp.]|uniref:DUF6538 domain-containing protein n=1 Tax=uncultured Roseibium sp. TaxID=1936171 RepID=UPI0026100296|nr:DUF6538 domain-containing protein [uncultured Roseibium sp.]
MKRLNKIGERYYYQRAVPTDLQETVNKKKWSVSLKTDSLRVAEIAAKRWDIFYDQEIVRLRSVDQQELLNAEATLRALGIPVPPDPLYSKEGNDKALQELSKRLRRLEGAFKDDRDESRVDFLKIAERGLSEIVPDKYERRDVARELFDGTLTPLAERALEGDRNQLQQAREQVSDIAPTDTPEMTKKRREALKTDLVDLWVETSKPTEQTEGDTRNATKELLEFSGQDDLRDVKKEDVVGWVDALRRFPARRKKLEWEISFRQVLELYDGRTYTPLSSKSIQKRFNLAQAVFSRAVKDGRLDSSPFNGISTPSFEATVLRKPFTIPMIKQIFSTEPLATGKLDGFYWTNALALSSGMRLGEICLCKPVDLVHQDGVWFFDMTAFKLKTLSSRRRVPVHRDLIDAGFDKWAKKQPAASIMGFKPDSKGSPSGLASKVVNRWFSSKVGISGEEYVFHSYRHLFKDLCREFGIAKDVHDRLTGHAGDNVGSGYGDFPIKVLSDAVNKIALPIKIRKAG